MCHKDLKLAIRRLLWHNSLTNNKGVFMKRGFLIDMDGVIYRGNEMIPGAVEFVDKLLSKDIPFLFLTNMLICLRNCYSSVSTTINQKHMC